MFSKILNTPSCLLCLAVHMVGLHVQRGGTEKGRFGVNIPSLRRGLLGPHLAGKWTGERGQGWAGSCDDLVSYDCPVFCESHSQEP